MAAIVVKLPMVRLESQDEMSQKAFESDVELLVLPYGPTTAPPAKRRAWPMFVRVSFRQACWSSTDYRTASYCACFILNLIGLGPFYSSTTILAWYTDRKLLSSSEAALISSFYVFTALWDPLTAAIIAKLGSRKSGCLGLALAVIGTLASSFCTEKPKLLWLFFGVLTGWGAGGFLVLVSEDISCCLLADRSLHFRSRHVSRLSTPTRTRVASWASSRPPTLSEAASLR
jgi:hypothetical protein